VNGYVNFKNTNERTEEFSGDGPGWGDMLPLVRRVKEFIDERCGAATVYSEPVPAAVLAGKFGFARRGGGKPEVVLAEETSVELGCPAVPSAAVLLLTRERGVVNRGAVTVIGADIPDADEGAKLPFAQVVMIETRRGVPPDPFDLDNIQYLMHRLPGYMTRSIPGKLWVRVGRKAKAAGFSFHTSGSALIEAYQSEAAGVAAAEIVFVTSSAADVKAISAIAAEAEIFMGRHRKLFLGADGEVECSDLNCDTCDEKPACDSLRDIVIKRRKLKS